LQSGFSNEISLFVQSSSNMPPSAPSNIQLGSYIDTGTEYLIPLSWQDNSSNETGFRCYWNATGSYNQFTSVGANIQTANFSPLSSYRNVSIYGYEAYLRFKVGAFNSYGENQCIADNVSHIVIPPKAWGPTNFTLNITKLNNIFWKFDYFWEDNSSFEEGFAVKWFLTPDDTGFGNRSRWTNANVTSYSESDICPNDWSYSTYYIKIYARIGYYTYSQASNMIKVTYDNGVITMEG